LISTLVSTLSLLISALISVRRLCVQCVDKYVCYCIDQSFISVLIIYWYY